MKPEEAISIIENMRPGCGEKLTYPEGEVCEGIDMAIEALREIQQYREIGTVEECKKAVERDRAKKPVIRKKEYSDEYYCPICGHVFIHKDETGWFCGQHYKRCPACEQAILWDLEKIMVYKMGFWTEEGGAERWQ